MHMYPELMEMSERTNHSQDQSPCTCVSFCHFLSALWAKHQIFSTSYYSQGRCRPPQPPPPNLRNIKHHQYKQYGGAPQTIFYHIGSFKCEMCMRVEELFGHMGLSNLFSFGQTSKTEVFFKAVCVLLRSAFDQFGLFWSNTIIF